MSELNEAMPEPQPVDLPDPENESLNTEEGLSQFLTVNTIEGAEEALRLAFENGGYDGAHHKMWVIDQMCRALTGENYDSFIAHAKQGEDGPETYEWDEGIAP